MKKILAIFLIAVMAIMSCRKEIIKSSDIDTEQEMKVINVTDTNYEGICIYGISDPGGSVFIHPSKGPGTARAPHSKQQ